MTTKSTIQPGELITAKEAARLLGVSYTRFRENWMKSRILRGAVRFPCGLKRRRFLRSEVLRYAKEGAR